MKHLDTTQKKVLLIWMVIALFVVILFFLLRFFPNHGTTQEKTSYELVKDYSRYYTVTGVIDKYYGYLNDKNKTSILHILDETYVEEQGITEDNVEEKLQIKEKNVSFQSGIMCAKRVSDTVSSYLVKGSIVGLNDTSTYEDAYYQVVLDEDSFHFSIRPIEAYTYEEDCHA